VTRKSSSRPLRQPPRGDGASDGGPRAALPTAEAAVYIGVAPTTLKKWRVTGAGPPYVRVGSKVVYMIEDLHAFLRARRVK
jgi:hypothetical protein